MKVSLPLEILIDELDGSLWVATVVNKRLMGLEIDPAGEEVRWGSIYWARVSHIDKELDAAYVELDIDNYGMLNNADVRIVNEKDGYSQKRWRCCYRQIVDRTGTNDSSASQKRIFAIGGSR